MAQGRVSTLLAEADILALGGSVSTLLFEVDINSRQGRVSALLAEVDVEPIDYLYIGQQGGTVYVTGFRFDNTTVTMGSVIVSATLQLYVQESDDEVDCKIQGVAGSWPGFWGSHMPAYAEPLTVAESRLEHADAIDEWAESDDLTTVLQEIIDQDGFDGVFTLILTGQDHDRQKVKAGPDATYGPKLTVTWMVP